MATMTMTSQEIKRAAKKNAKNVPENERFMRACSDIANALIQDYESHRDSTKPKKDLNLNKLRATFSKKHSLSNSPPLTAIIAAVPEHYKKYILPKLIAKPIRTFTFKWGHWTITNLVHRNLLWYRCGGGYVQTPSMPPHRVYR
jgi:Histone acetyltransferase